MQKKLLISLECECRSSELGEWLRSRENQSLRDTS